jgi:hypothetical protein
MICGFLAKFSLQVRASDAKDGNYGLTGHRSSQKDLPRTITYLLHSDSRPAPSSRASLVPRFESKQLVDIRRHYIISSPPRAKTCVVFERASNYNPQ